MAVGSSGRIVLEVDPELKRQIYEVLNLSGRTLKEWFIEKATDDLLDKRQLPLEFNVSTAEVIL